jgi:CRP-like cAMP-binding protein
MAHPKRLPPIVHLKFSKGELIIKEGDYGISIYKILQGRVLIFIRSGSDKLPLAELHTGEVFGEMSFFNFLYEPRSASAEALEDVELEVWHPARLNEEYKNMPPVLTYLSRQMLDRLLRMNKVIDVLTTKQRTLEEETKKPESLGKRKHYRKSCDLICHYRDVEDSSKESLRGVIKDINPFGAGLEVPISNALHGRHLPGEEIEINFSIPPGSAIITRAKIRSVRKGIEKNQMLMGLEFTNLSRHPRKKIGFFSMA